MSHVFIFTCGTLFGMVVACLAAIAGYLLAVFQNMKKQMEAERD